MSMSNPLMDKTVNLALRPTYVQVVHHRGSFLYHSLCIICLDPSACSLQRRSRNYIPNANIVYTQLLHTQEGLVEASVNELPLAEIKEAALHCEATGELLFKYNSGFFFWVSELMSFEIHYRVSEGYLLPAPSPCFSLPTLLCIPSTMANSRDST